METFEKLKRAYGDEVLSKAQVFRWHKTFKEGRENVEDEHCSGRPCTVKSDENVERVRSLVATDRRLTVRFVANELNMNKNGTRTIRRGKIMSHEQVKNQDNDHFFTIKECYTKNLYH
jgi:hypothetical protein